MDGFLAGIFLVGFGCFLIIKANQVQLLLSSHITNINRMFRMISPKQEKTNANFIKAFGVVWFFIGCYILFLEF